MTSVKTAISVPSKIFEQAEAVALAMNVSRSRLYVQALEEYLRQREIRRLLEQINAAYADGLTPEEEQLLAATRRYQRAMIENEW